MLRVKAPDLDVILELPDVALPVRLGITVGDDPGHRLRTFGQAAELLGPGVQRGGELLKSISQSISQLISDT